MSRRPFHGRDGALQFDLGGSAGVGRLHRRRRSGGQGGRTGPAHLRRSLEHRRDRCAHRWMGVDHPFQRRDRKLLLHRPLEW